MAAMAAQEASAQGTEIQKSLSEGTPMCVLNDSDMQNDARQAHGAGVNLHMNIADQPIIAAEEETQGNDQESDGNRITLDADTGDHDMAQVPGGAAKVEDSMSCLRSERSRLKTALKQCTKSLRNEARGT